MACKDHWDSRLQRLVLHPRRSLSLVYHVASEMRDELAAVMLRHNCLHFQGQFPSLQFSNLAVYQHHLVTFDKLLWSGSHPSHSDSVGVGCNLEGRVLNAPQVILNCSYIWEGRSPSFCFCDTGLVVKATSGQQYSCCVAWREDSGTVFLQPKQE